MSRPEGHYRRLQALQSLEKTDEEGKDATTLFSASVASDSEAVADDGPLEAKDIEAKESGNQIGHKARLLSRGDEGFFAVGALGGILAGLMFPGWGFIFAHMLELMYRPVLFCDEETGEVCSLTDCQDFGDCSAHRDPIADDMQEISFKLAYGLLGILFSALVGHALVWYGFGTASERMNKRVRDAAFKNIVRQEISWFDTLSVEGITTQISEDAAKIHSFSGEPICALVMNLSSVFVGLVVSFYFMWCVFTGSWQEIPFLYPDSESNIVLPGHLHSSRLPRSRLWHLLQRQKWKCLWEKMRELISKKTRTHLEAL